MMARNGDTENGRKKVQFALYCNIASIIGAVVGYITLVVVIPIIAVIVPTIIRVST